MAEDAISLARILLKKAACGRSGCARSIFSGGFMTTTTLTRNTLSASTLIGDKVKNSKKEDLGKIEDFMIDLTTGRIAYSVLSFGGFMGVGNKLFAVPWSATTIDTIDKCFILDVPKERLKDAPGFDKDNWPDLNDADYRGRVYAFYNVKPDWQ
jgi:sporulation protein YlmC with PRC-barrel domain